MDLLRKFDCVRPACSYNACSYHKNDVIDLEKSCLPRLLSFEVPKEHTVRTRDGFPVSITSDCVNQYYIFRLLNVIDKDEQLKLKKEAQQWINSVKKATTADEFTGHIDGIDELPLTTGERVRYPNFWRLEYVTYNYSISTSRQAAGLCLLYDHVVLGKLTVHAHGN